MLEKLRPGQTVRCTVTRTPRRAAAIDTIERLMRLDPTHARGLRRAQRRRRQDLNVYVRGNREWTSRERCAKVVRVARGETWTLSYSFQVAPDLESVKPFVSVEPA
jgi:hypothetical protein